MNLSDVRDFVLRNRWRTFAALLLLLGLMVALGLIFRESAPDTLEEDKLPALTLSHGSGGVIASVDASKLVSVSTPPAAIIYRVERDEKTITKEQAIAFAKKFGLPALSSELPTPLGTIFVFSGRGEELTITSSPRELHYFSEGGRGSDALPDSEAAVRKAKDALTAKELPDPGSLSPTVRYLSSFGERTAEAERGIARFVEIILPWGVGGTDILGESLTDAAARIVFDSSGKLIYLTFKFKDYSFAASRNLPLKDFDEAVRDLQQMAQIVLVRPINEGDAWAISDYSRVSSFAPESMRLVYVKQAEGDILYPVYLFEGLGRSGRVDIKVAVYVPAVPDQYTRD